MHQALQAENMKASLQCTICQKSTRVTHLIPLGGGLEIWRRECLGLSGWETWARVTEPVLVTWLPLEYGRSNTLRASSEKGNRREIERVASTPGDGNVCFGCVSPAEMKRGDKLERLKSG